MKTFLLTLGAVSALAVGPVHAAELLGDSDGNGTLSLAEVQALYPLVTQAVYTAADTNHDGVLDEGELKTGEESGAIHK